MVIGNQEIVRREESGSLARGSHHLTDRRRASQAGREEADGKKGRLRAGDLFQVVSGEAAAFPVLLVHRRAVRTSLVRELSKNREIDVGTLLVNHRDQILESIL